ncbi:MAG: DUF934 domain-containing protein [Rhodospirillales bacterium]|nr:DUF934 domain-containing protein [Rhodospirillales bacterium]
MPLIKNGHVTTDPWITIPDDMPVPANGQVIVSLERWRADGAELKARGEPVGVRLSSSQLAPEIANDLSHLALIAIEFPSFRDGRAYSTARLLRQRYGFRGELRAVGNVLRDQFMFMHRCGFDAFEINKSDDAAAWHKAMCEISVWYQTAVDVRASVVRRRHYGVAAE